MVSFSYARVPRWYTGFLFDQLHTCMIYLTDQGTGNVLTLQEAKQQVRCNTNDDDDYITSLIVDALDYIEHDTGISFFSSTWVETFPCIEGRTVLMKYPVTEISGITYLDQQSNQQTLDVDTTMNVMLPTFSQASFQPKWSVVLPVTIPHPEAWSVEFVTATTPPPIAKRAAKMLVESWYSMRGAEVPYGNSREIVFGVSNMLRKLDKRGQI